MERIRYHIVMFTVADPGFPRGGGTPTYDFVEFSPKLHEIERIWTPGGRGGASPAPPLDSPLVHTGPRQAQGPGPIVSHCASRVSFTGPGPIPVQCEEVLRGENKERMKVSASRGVCVGDGRGWGNRRFKNKDIRKQFQRRRTKREKNKRQDRKEREHLQRKGRNQNDGNTTWFEKKKLKKKEKYFQRIGNKKTEGINKKSSTGKHPRSFYFSLPFALKFFSRPFIPDIH